MDTEGEQRFATGVQGLDAIMWGGLIRGRLYLLDGDPGAGKTTFALQYLLEGKRILVVDDNIDAATSVAELLRLERHEVFVVHSANAAMERFQIFGPEVILLYIGLPDMNGYQVARRIRTIDGAV